MEKEQIIILLAEYHRKGGLFPDRKASVSLSFGNSKVLVNGQSITDVFYNGLQLRLYIGGSHKENEKTSIHEATKCPFYMIFEENNNDKGLSLKDLNSEIEKTIAGA